MGGKLVQNAMVLGFLAILFMGFLNMLRPPDSERLRAVEFREALAIEWPQDLGSDSLKQFFASLGMATNDRLPFRWQMLSTYARICFFLGISPFPDRVLFGQDKWLFLGNGFDDVVDKHRGARPMTPGDLDAAMVSLRTRRMACSARGMVFLFVVAPNKHSIYPEFLPDWANDPKSERRIAPLLRVASDERLPVLDLAPAVRKAKGMGELVYFRGDSHWNQLGAFIGFREIARRLHHERADIPVPSLDEVNIRRLAKRVPGGLLRIAMLAPKTMPADDNVICWYTDRSPEETIRQTHPLVRELPLAEAYWNITERNRASFENPGARVNARLLLLRDSFSTNLHPYFCEMFTEVIEVHHHSVNDKSFVGLLERERPDIVIWETVERLL